MNLSFLNPVNWIKSGFAAKADAEIDRLLTSKNLECCGRNGVNYLIQLSESKVDDDKLEKVANDLIYAGVVSLPCRDLAAEVIILVANREPCHVCHVERD